LWSATGSAFDVSGDAVTFFGKFFDGKALSCVTSVDFTFSLQVGHLGRKSKRLNRQVRWNKCPHFRDAMSFDVVAIRFRHRVHDIVAAGLKIEKNDSSDW
jgi:hypothetical protein